MARLGMDVDVVESLGKQLRTQGQSIRMTVGKVDALINQAGQHWYGGRGRSFVNQWQTIHRQHLLTVAESIEGLGQSALNNAAEQRGVSGDGGSAISGPHQQPSVHAGNAGLSSFLKTPEMSAAAAILGVTGLLSTLGKNSSLVGRYGGVYQTLFGQGEKMADFWRYKKALNGPFQVNGLADALDNSSTLGWLGKGLTGLSVIDGVGTLLDEKKPWEERVGAGWGAAMSLMKTSKNPVAYLGGVAGSSIGLAVAAGSQVDWSASGARMVWDEVSRNPGVIVEELGKSATKMLTEDIWKIF